jgi:hypothetical protein
MSFMSCYASFLFPSFAIFSVVPYSSARNRLYFIVNFLFVVPDLNIRVEDIHVSHPYLKLHSND